MRPRDRWLVGGALAVAAVAAIVVTGRDRSAPAGPSAPAAPRSGGLSVTLDAAPRDVIVGEAVQLTAAVARGDHRGALRWTWIAARGALAPGRDGQAAWTAPGKPGRYGIAVGVEDDGGRARATLTLEVRLPSPAEVADLTPLMQRLAERSRREAAAQAALEQQAAALVATGARRDSIEDRLRAQLALEELATIYEQLGRFDDARAVYDELLRGMLVTDAKYRGYQARLGDVAFFLGDEAAASLAWAAGGDYVQGLSRYYQGEVLERAGATTDAAAAYARAAEGARWFGDPVYRRALLALQTGADADRVADLLVEASPRLDRDRMLARLREDDELAPVRAALERSGRAGDLQPAQVETLEAAPPGR